MARTRRVGRRNYPPRRVAYKMSNKTFTQQTKDWVEFLGRVKTCHFIGEKSTGKNGEEYGKICMKPSMKNFMGIFEYA